MANFWSVLIALITDYLTKWLNPISPSLVPRFSELLNAAAKDMPAPTSFGAAPDELKVLVRKLITDLVNKHFANRPLVAKILVALADNLPDSLIDKLWDSIFKAGAVSTPAPVRSAFNPDVNPVLSALMEELA